MTGRNKLVFHLDQGSGGAGSSRLLLYAASTSAGTASVSVGIGSPLYASATSASGGTTLVELRGEYLANQSVGPWVFPVLSVAGASVVAAVHANGFVESYMPANNNDAPAGYATELDLF